MLNIILLILKIIGIILLSILGLLILAVLIVLFVPVRYKINVTYFDTVVADIRISWLLHILSFRIHYEEALTQTLKIFGIKFRPPGDKKVPRKKKQSDTSELSTEGTVTDDSISENTITEDSISEEVISDHMLQEKNKLADEEAKLNDTEETSETVEETGFLVAKLKAFIKKIKEFVKWLIGLKNKIVYTIKGFYDKMLSLGEKLEFYTEFLQDEAHITAFKLCFSQLGKLIRHIRPRKHHLWFHIGFEDPQTLGNVLSILSIANAYTGGALHIQPDFEHTVFEGKVYLKGRVQAIVLLRIAWIIYFDKNVKQLLKDFKEEDQ